MLPITASEARKNLYKLLKENQRVEIKSSSNIMVLVPKAYFDQLELDMLNREMDEALKGAHKWYTSQEVDAMLAEVFSRQERKKKRG